MKFLETYPTPCEILLEDIQDYTFDQKCIIDGVIHEVFLASNKINSFHLIERDLDKDQLKTLFRSVIVNYPKEKQSGSIERLGDKVANSTTVNLAKKGAEGLSVLNKAVGAIAKKYVGDTEPVKNFDEKFDKLKTSLVQKLGGDDDKIVKVVANYGKWAKKIPGKQALIIGLLVGGLALATGRAGDAAVGMFLRGGNNLLQDDKFSTSVGEGLEPDVIDKLTGKSANESYIKNNPMLTEAELKDVAAFAKKIASKIGDKAKDVGKLDDKSLIASWKKASRPTDAQALGAFLKKLEVPNDVITIAFNEIGITAKDSDGETDNKATDNMIDDVKYDPANPEAAIMAWAKSDPIFRSYIEQALKTL